MSVQENQHAPAPLELDLREEGTAVQEERQGSARLERERRAGPWLQDEPEIRAALAQEDRQGRTAAPSPLAAIVEAVPQDVTLSLAQLPFEGAEPTNDALEELAALAERLLRELGPRVLIEADFNLPDPEARTVVERRVEVVRAILVRRGIEPARLVVRAAGGGPVQQPVTAPFVESPD